MLLFLQPKKESSFALADSLWLLGGFELIQGANEFVDMWRIIHPVQGQFPATGPIALPASYFLLLEFGRRSVKALCREVPALCVVPPWLYGRALTPALFALALALSARSGDFMGALPEFSRLLLGFPAALISGLAFIGYAFYREDTLVRLKARKYFLLAGNYFPGLRRARRAGPSEREFLPRQCP